MLCLAFFGFYYSFYTIQLHIAPHAEDLGISAANAAFIISIIGVASIVGRLGLGFIGDKLGTKLGLLICSLILIAGLSWLQIAGSLMMLYIFALIHGIFHGGFQSLTSPATASLFGTKSMGIIFGATQFFAMSLGSLGGVLSGYFYDRFNNYVFAFLVCLALAVLSLIFLSLIRPIRKTA